VNRPPRRLRLVTGRDLPDGDPETRFLARALSEAGWAVDVAVWSDPSVRWAGCGLTVLRSTWDYPDHLDAFVAWCERTAGVTSLHNPPGLVAGNVDKRYLMALENAGVPVIPSRWLADANPDALARLSRREGWPQLVVKPAVGVDGLGLRRWPPEDGPAIDEDGPEGASLRPEGDADHGWIVQPYVASVRTRGERSVVMLDGRPAWSVEKRPAPDCPDIRVQERWGGSTRTTAPDAEADAVAARALAMACPGAAPLYARVDLLVHDGGWHVTEVELIEPSLYFLEDRTRVNRFDAALRGRLES
jgi:glutathione synthase/RimK-type ligase-like ATP-grasp enzyme